MTLAYVFWHRPRVDTDQQEYGAALRAFHAALAGSALPGLLGSWTVRAQALPWLGEQEVYEDRYLIEDFTALGRLNEAAVAAGQRGAHDAAAGRAGWGTAGLYALVQGPAEPRPTRAWWFDKPAGTTYEQFQEQYDGAAGTLWQRQLTLGPGPEFQLLADSAPGLPTTHESGVDPL